MQNKYLLKVTFYAGSDEPEDTDKGMYILTTNQILTYAEVKDLFYETARKLSVYDEDGKPELGISYDNGVNIDTFMDGVLRLTKKTDKNAFIESIDSDCGEIAVNNFYEITQWQ